MRVAPRDIFLEAARLMERDGIRAYPSCTYVYMAAVRLKAQFGGGLDNAYRKAMFAYHDFYAPRRGNAGLWFGDFNITNHNARILALCFMASVIRDQEGSKC